MRILYWPSRSPDNFSRWLAGGIRKSCNVSAPSRSSSFRRALRWMSCGSLRENWRRNNFAVSSSCKALDHGADDNASRYDCRALLCIGNVNTLCVERHLGSKPNAGSQPRLEAGARGRTLEGVGSSALFGSDSARGSAHGRAPSFIAPRAIDSASRVHDDLHSADNLVCLEQDHGRQRESRGPEPS